jgi:RNA polymerase sigma-70 factor (ECF subfamily)
MAGAVLVDQGVDEELIQRLRAGDKEAFTKVYDRHCQRVFTLIYRVVATRAVAEELTQDVFLSAFVHLAKSDQIEDVQAWLCRTATNRALMHLRSERVREVVRKEPTRAEDDVEDPQGQVGFQASAAKSIWSAAKSLSPLQRAVLVLRYLDDQSYEQIAKTVERPVETIKVLLHNAKRRFRSELARMLASRPGSPPACRDRGQQIAAWLAGDFPAAQLPALQAHLADCSYCRETRAQLEDVRGEWLLLPPLAVPIPLRDHLFHSASQLLQPVNGAMRLTQAGVRHARRETIRQAWHRAVHSRALRVVAPAVLAIAVGAAVMQHPFPNLSTVLGGAAANGQLVHARISSGVYAFLREGDIWIKPAHGAVARVTRLGNVTYYRWSPDGRWMALLTKQPDPKLGFDLYTVRGDGRNLRLIRRSVSTMAWSPDSNQLAVLWLTVADVLNYSVDIVQPTTGWTRAVAHFTNRAYDGPSAVGNTPDPLPFDWEIFTHELLAWTKDGIYAYGLGTQGQQPAPGGPGIELLGVVIDPVSGAMTTTPSSEVGKVYVSTVLNSVPGLYMRVIDHWSHDLTAPNSGLWSSLRWIVNDTGVIHDIDIGRGIFGPSFDPASNRLLFSVLIVTNATVTGADAQPIRYAYRTEVWAVRLDGHSDPKPFLTDGSYLPTWQPPLSPYRIPPS